MFRKRHSYLWATLLSLFTGYTVLAQECDLSLSGQVIDEHDGHPLSFATIYLVEIERGMVADSTGKFLIEKLCPGIYTVRCSHLGCEDIEETLEIQDHTVFNFYPEHHTALLEGLTITAHADNQHSSYTEDELTADQMANNQGRSLGQMLEEMPGVTGLQTGSSISKPVIHGLEGNRVLIFNNGVRLEAQQWGSEHAPEIDVNSAATIKVIKGAGALQYGADAIGGIVLLEPAAMKDSAGLSASYGVSGWSNGRGTAADLRLDGKWAKLPAFAWRAEGSVKRTGNVYAPDYFLANTASKEFNGAYAIQYQKGKWTSTWNHSLVNMDLAVFAGSHIGNLTDLLTAFESDTPLVAAEFTYALGRPYQHVIHETALWRNVFEFSHHNFIQLDLSRQYNLRQEYDAHSKNANPSAELDLEHTTHQLELFWHREPSQTHHSTIGLHGSLGANTYAGRYFIPNYWRRVASAYWIENLTLGPWQIDIGGRYDVKYFHAFPRNNGEVQSTVTTFNAPSFSGGAEYHISDKWSVKGNVAYAWRPPSVNELFTEGVHHGAAAYEIGDPNLDIERALQSSSELTYIGSSIQFSTNVYFNAINDFIYLVPQENPTLTIRGAFPTFKTEQVDATLFGADAKLDWLVNHRIRIQLNGQFIRGVDQTNDRALVGIPPVQTNQRLSYLLMEGDAIKWLRLTLSSQKVFKRYDLQDDQDYVPIPDGYWVFGTSLTSAVKWGEHGAKLGLYVDNLFNARYRSYMNRFRYYSDELGRNFTLRFSVPIHDLLAPKTTEK